MFSNIQSWVKGNETSTVHFKSRTTDYMSGSLTSVQKRVKFKVSGCKKKNKNDVKETWTLVGFSLMSILTLIATVPKETIQIIFGAILCT